MYTTNSLTRGKIEPDKNENRKSERRGEDHIKMEEDYNLRK